MCSAGAVLGCLVTRRNSDFKGNPAQTDTLILKVQLLLNLNLYLAQAFLLPDLVENAF